MTDREVTAMEQYYEMEVLPFGYNQFNVKSLVSHKEYEVDLVRQTCSCPDHRERQVKCKHIWRVEKEGYVAYDPPGQVEPKGSAAPFAEQEWKPDSDFVWFNSFQQGLGSKVICLVAPGKKKLYKFWIAIPDHPRKKVLTICWGDCSREDLHGLGRPNIGQSKEIPVRNTYNEARVRAGKKRPRGYRAAEAGTAKQILNAAGFSGHANFGKEDHSFAPESANEKTKEEKKQTDWKPDEDFVWF